MFRSNTMKSLMMGMFVLGLLLVGLGMTWTPVAAAGTGQELCEDPTGYDGLWLGSSPDEIGGNCITNNLAPDYFFCPVAGDTVVAEWTGNWSLARPKCSSEHGYPGGPDAADAPAASAGPDGTPLNYGMERKGICKLMDVSDAFFGGYITATVKGSPSFLLLKLDGKTFKLPVVPGSVVANGNGSFTAQFYTMDPATGQALVPAGEYMVRCSGGSGSNDGSNNTITISY